MQTFSDRVGRVWTIGFTVASATRLKADGINLYNLAENKFTGLFELLADPERFVATLYTLCRDEVKAAWPDAGDGAELFADVFDGDAVERASVAFLDAALDFFPNQAGRAAMRRLVTKSREMITARVATAEIEAMKSLESSLNATSGSGPESAESTPAPLPTASSP